MKLKDLKKILDKMTPEQLKEDFLYNSETYSVSGVVEAFVKAKQDLYYTGDDDLATLYTKAQLKAEGHDNEEIEDMAIEIEKGSFYVKF